MASGNDLSSERCFSQNIDSSIVIEKPFLSGYSSVMSEGGGDADVPELFLSGDFFDLSMYGVGGGHYQRSEVFCLEDDNVIVVLLALIVIVTSG